jgi:hypothetical protein
MHLNQETIVVRKDKTGSSELSVSEVAADEDSAKIEIPLRESSDESKYGRRALRS